MHALEGPLHITARINDKPTRGVIIDLVCMTNVVIEEFLYTHELYQDNYDKFEALIKVHDGFS